MGIFSDNLFRLRVHQTYTNTHTNTHCVKLCVHKFTIDARLSSESVLCVCFCVCSGRHQNIIYRVTYTIGDVFNGRAEHTCVYLDIFFFGLLNTACAYGGAYFYAHMHTQMKNHIFIQNPQRLKIAVYACNTYLRCTHKCTEAAACAAMCVAAESNCRAIERAHKSTLLRLAAVTVAGVGCVCADLNEPKHYSHSKSL